MSTPPYVTMPPGARRLSLPVADCELAAIEMPARAPRRATVLLVPGFTGSKEDFVAVLEPFAEAGYRTVAIDQRGQHESPHPPTPAAYALDALARDVLDVVDHLGDRPLHLLGHSFGGLVARAAALADPGAFRSVTLLGSGPAAIPDPRAATIRTLLDALPLLDLAQIWSIRKELDAEAGVPLRAPEIEAFMQSRFVANDPAGLAAMGRLLLDEPDRCDALAATGLPVLVAYGEMDDAWPPELQAAMAERMGVPVTVITGAAHSPAAEMPTETAKALVAFWSDVDGGAR